VAISIAKEPTPCKLKPGDVVGLLYTMRRGTYEGKRADSGSTLSQGRLRSCGKGGAFVVGGRPSVCHCEAPALGAEAISEVDRKTKIGSTDTGRDCFARGGKSARPRLAMTDG